MQDAEGFLEAPESRHGRAAGASFKLFRKNRGMGVRRAAKKPPDLVHGHPSDLGVKPESPFPCKLIQRIDEDSQVRSHILDMSLFKKTNPGADLERDPAPRHLHLHFHRMVVGTIQNGDLLKSDAAAVKFQNALGDEIGLLENIAGRHKNRPNSSLSCRPQRFLKLIFIVDNAQVCQV